MRSSILLFCLLITFQSLFAQAITADILHAPVTCKGRPTTFWDASTTFTGAINSWQWNFGDGGTSSVQNPQHTYLTTGFFTVSLRVTNTAGMTSTVTKTVTVNQRILVDFNITPFDSCSPINRGFTFSDNSGLSSATTRYWSFGDGTGVSGVSYAEHTYASVGTYRVDYYTDNVAGCGADTISKFLQVPLSKQIVPTSGLHSRQATYECTDEEGWTNYFNDNNTPLNRSDDTLLLSLKKNGNNIGSVGSGGFQVQTTATIGAGSGTGILLTNPLITNPSGFWVMNRYWQVVPTTQPTTPVGVRFYYNTQDLLDVNGSYPTHNLSHTDLLFYKTVGGNPDPTTNLLGATSIISIKNGTTPSVNKWVYRALGGDRHMAEFEVASFSGGGGGATGNLQVLPFRLLSFTAQKREDDVRLNWQVANPLEAEHYTIEKSTNGTAFFTIHEQVVRTHDVLFTWTDQVKMDHSRLYYRLKTKNRNGTVEYSSVVAIKENSNLQGYAVTPHPAKDYMIVTATRPLPHPVRLSLVDLNGKEIWLQRRVLSGVDRVNLPRLSTGTYLLRIEGGATPIFSTKISVQQ